MGLKERKKIVLLTACFQENLHVQSAQNLALLYVVLFSQTGNFVLFDSIEYNFGFLYIF